MKENGYEVEHNGQLITVFSAPNYCDQMGNKVCAGSVGGLEWCGGGRVV